MKKVRFTPGDTNYRWNDLIDSPFSKRNLVIFPFDSMTKAKLLVVKQKYYELFFKNEKGSYLSRNLYSSPIQNKKDQPKYQEENHLIGNTRQIKYSISKLLKRILSSLEENPQNLFEEAEKIRTICAEEKFTIPKIEAFDHLSDWDEFIELLTSIDKKEYSFKFEFLIAAINQYALLCSGKR